MSTSDDQRSLILVAEDDRDISALVKFQLEADGYEVLTALDGEEALRLAFERRPDLAMLDVKMPAADGYEVTRAIRQNEETSAMPVILVTAAAREQDAARGFEAGANSYIRKPFDLEELDSRVEAALKDC